MGKWLISVMAAVTLASAAEISLPAPTQEYTDSCRTIEYNSTYTKLCDDLYYNLAKFAYRQGFSSVAEYIEQVLRDEIEYQEQTAFIRGQK